MRLLELKRRRVQQPVLELKRLPVPELVPERKRLPGPELVPVLERLPVLEPTPQRGRRLEPVLVPVLGPSLASQPELAPLLRALQQEQGLKLPEPELPPFLPPRRKTDWRQPSRSQPSQAEATRPPLRVQTFAFRCESSHWTA